MKERIFKQHETRKKFSYIKTTTTSQFRLFFIYMVFNAKIKNLFFFGG
jgi:hypothetical protein